MVKSEIKDFTKGNITKQLIIFALPILLSNLSLPTVTLKKAFSDFQLINSLSLDVL